MSRRKRSASTSRSRPSPRRANNFGRAAHAEDTETESWIENDYSRIRDRKPRSPPVAVDRDAKRFDELCAKIEEQRRAIALLGAENSALKAEVARCEEKIASYPRMKRKYDRLSASLSQIAEARSQARRKQPI
jgi:predicted RNase H-like nuclease (RuvC/YqgF family)